MKSKWLTGALVLVAAAYAATGLYAVGPDQRAVVRRFGKVIADDVPSGLHLGLPWGLDRVDLIKPNETKAVSVGVLGSADRLLGAAPADSLAQFLTGDQNLVNVRATVQYTIRDPKQYLLQSADPEPVVARAAETAITATLAHQPIDTVITTRLTASKDELAILVRDQLQSLLDAYGLGIEVRSVNLTEVAPPPQLADAFTRAASARSERERLVIEAQTYANEKLAQAQSESRQLIDQAKADRARTTDRAGSDRDRFEKLFYEYQKNETVTVTRLYLETMAEILPRFRSKVIIDSGKGVDVMLMRDER